MMLKGTVFSKAKSAIVFVDISVMKKFVLVNRISIFKGLFRFSFSAAYLTANPPLLISTIVPIIMKEDTGNAAIP